MEAIAKRALLADINAAIWTDYREAGKSHKQDISVLRARVLTAIENGQPQTRAFVAHRRAWRAALGLPALC